MWGIVAAIIEDENYYNEKPKANQQWLLMKFWLKNTGSGRLDAWDVLGANDFYTRTGASATVWEVAAFAGTERIRDFMMCPYMAAQKDISGLVS